MKSRKRKFKNYVLAVASLLIFNSCSSDPGGDSAEPASGEGRKTELHTIEMSQMKFNPAELNVKKGDSVVFVNHDMVAHDVTEKSAKAWNSSPMAEGQTWILVATETVDYYCSIHPVMTGKIVVE